MKLFLREKPRPFADSCSHCHRELILEILTKYGVHEFSYQTAVSLLRSLLWLITLSWDSFQGPVSSDPAACTPHTPPVTLPPSLDRWFELQFAELAPLTDIRQAPCRFDETW